jgi:dynamin 1-like protein
MGIRTIGVYTFVDTMDRGTNAMCLLVEKIPMLRLGFKAVINRNQEDINSKMTIKQAIEKEQKFFNSHPVYSKKPNI